MQQPYTNDGRKAVKDFLTERAAEELPVPTVEQVNRAAQLANGNPMLRGHRTGLGLQLLALRIPLTRRERMANRKTIGVELKPKRCRPRDGADAWMIEANADAVAAFVDAHPGLSPGEIALLVAEFSGYPDRGALLIKRVERWSRSPVDRMPGHIRDKMLVLSAMAQAAKLVEQRLAEAPPAEAVQ